ncbi:membrane-bound O-acyltransferase domain-containing protein 2-like [Asterias rubens]|uniref:membrane-bound O-acyltransferase domain-containing protein 2-like n=1 Tax=Asterias rubens TaxID=7604 RepID=UPI001455AB85|nr:membrane-bound O-acyltransferase domain-containing protein 2-like [Asterias rubens]
MFLCSTLLSSNMEVPNPIAYVATKLGVRVEEVNFVFCQCTALIYSYLFRWYLNPRWVSPTSRHLAQILLGLSLACVSFGWGVFHILLGAGVAYLMILFFNPKMMQYYVLVFTILHLSWVHLYMQVRNAGVGNLDYIGPLMILTVKLSALAFSIHDGFTKDEASLTKLQKELVVRRYPRFLEFWSYIFCPQGLLVGPVCFFSSYIDFIEGKNFSRKVKDENGEEKIIFDEPSSKWAVTTKLLFTVFCCIVLVKVAPKYPIMANVSDEVLNRSFLYRFGYLLLSIEVAKSKYFTAWVWADAINNAAGLGFSGYDKNGHPTWAGITNVDIVKFQTATSLKMLIDNWNIRSAKWLKFVCYDRVPFSKRFFTFLLSAIWHGFYPGYFATFISAPLFVSASFKVRYLVRPYFLSSTQLKLFYDVITWACTYISLAYVIVPFSFLKLDLTLKYFNSVYWCLHILCLLILLTFPSKPKPGKHKSGEKTDQNGLSTPHQGDYAHTNGAPSIRDVVSDTQGTEGRKER